MRRAHLHYERYFLTYEAVAALMVSATIIAVVEFGWGTEHLAEMLAGIRQGLYATIAAVAGSLLGFIVTTVSIIVGFLRFPRLRLVRESRYYSTLYTIFFSAIRYLALTTAWSLLSLLLDRDNAPKVWVSYVLLSVAAVAAIRLCRCVWVLEKVIGITSRSDGGESG